MTSWSSHCTKTGTSALKARTLSSMKLYLCAARNSSSVSATFAFSGIVTFFQILPSAKLHLALDRPVGIDGVAGMQQEIRAMLAHGGEGEHAAIVGIDAPALSGDVAAPDEADVAAIGRRGAEPSDSPARSGRRYARGRETGCDRRSPARQGRFSSSILAVKSLSGSAAIGGSARALANDSVVATSTIICEGRSARAHTTPPSAPMSPDCTPWCQDRPVGGTAEIGHRKSADGAGTRGGKKTATGKLARNPERHASSPWNPARECADRPRRT